MMILKLLAALSIGQTSQGGSSAWISPTAAHHYYGSMRQFENVDPMTIDSDNWLLVYTAGDWVTGSVNGIVFQDGATDVVSDAFADAGGSPNEVTVTAADHPFSALEIVSIGNSTNYESVYQIQSVTTHTFNIVETFNAEAADSQTVTRGGNLTITNAGVYQVSFHASVAPANGQDVVDFNIWATVTAGVPDFLDASETRIETKTAANYTALAGCAIWTAAAGEKISFGVKNTTAQNNVTFRYINVGITQL